MQWSWEWIFPFIAFGVAFTSSIAIVFLPSRPSPGEARYWRRMRYKIMALGLAMVALGVIDLIERLRVPPLLYLLYCFAFIAFMFPAIAMEIRNRSFDQPG